MAARGRHPDGRPHRGALTDLRFGVYLITDRAQTAGRPLLAVVAAALAGGVGAVQLREPDLDGRALLDLARALRGMTRARGAALLINDRIDVALACDADGVHLPAGSFRVADARALLGPARCIAVSTHSAAEVAAAAAAGADFAVFGPVFDTPSKRPFGAPLGLDVLAAVCAGTSLPVLAIGGVDADNATAVRAHGASGIAVIRAVLAAPDPALAAVELTKGFGKKTRQD